MSESERAFFLRIAMGSFANRQKRGEKGLFPESILHCDQILRGERNFTTGEIYEDAY